MKAKELMIGDWVSVKSCPKPNFYKISKLDPNMESSVYPIHVERHAEGLSYTFLDKDEIEPIQLTAEILKKNGFEEYVYASLHTFYYDKKYIISYFDNLGFSIDINHHNMKIHYVHELQHALRLCNIDKEIEL